jgi:hypothetical protein
VHVQIVVPAPSSSFAWQTDVFGLEVLHNIIFSLSLAHHDDASLGTADRLANVILAFARVLARNASALLKPNTQRRQHPDLREFIDWLFTVWPEPSSVRVSHSITHRSSILTANWSIREPL